MDNNKGLEKLILLAGMSGAGKTTVIHLLEDLGFFYIENLPVTLIIGTIQRLEKYGEYKKIVIGLDSRSFEKDLHSYINTISHLQNTATAHEIWSLDAKLDILMTRYNETRRRHPFTGAFNTLKESLVKEKEVLEPFFLTASKSIDTSTLKVAELKNIVKKTLGELGERQLQINIFSFGFKYSLPEKIDYLFDVRCLPNPYWHHEIKKYSGLDQPVKEFFSLYEQVKVMEDDIFDFMVKRIPDFQNSDRSYLDIGIGCTGGHHRSVFLTDQIGIRLQKLYPLVNITHRDL